MVAVCRESESVLTIELEVEVGLEVAAGHCKLQNEGANIVQAQVEVGVEVQVQDETSVSRLVRRDEI